MTAIFASVGINLQTFLIAAFLALPKQFASVYFGVAENSGAPTDQNGSTYHHITLLYRCSPVVTSSLTPPLCDSADKSPSKTTKIIKILVLTATVVVTFVAMRYVNSRIDAIKNRVIYARRKARQTTVSGAGVASSSWVAFPQDEAEAQVRTPFMPLAQHESAQVAYYTKRTPQAHSSRV